MNIQSYGETFKGEPNYLNHNVTYSYNVTTQEYEVHFKIKYVTKLYEDLFDTGDITERGSAGDLKRHPLKWTEGHIWVSERPLRTSTPLFRYNYIMIDQKSGKQIDNQEGFTRIADLKSIASHNRTHFVA